MPPSQATSWAIQAFWPGECDERFFELGGWKDTTETAETGVTDTTTNVYANRVGIRDRYRNQPELTASQFWYHAELFDTDRLTHLAAPIGAPDLSKILARLKNPMLLCYYLFYPAHVQGVDKDVCPNIEARELACHAGDWQCIAIMLQGTGNGSLDSATPRFFGITGMRPARTLINGNWVYPPHQFDDEEMTAMKVEAWRPASGDTANQPELADEHPRLYVAEGSHSMYMTPGSHPVDAFPDDKQSANCGRFDPALTAPSSLLPGVSQILTKLLAGGILNIGPAGLAAALAACVAEGLIGPSGLDLDVTDEAGPDQAPAMAGDGKTVRPAGLVLPDGGSDVADWAAQQGLQLNNRRYDFIVDRANQVWWPDDKMQTGFRGRWGQRVTSDPLARRSGPRFPLYWKMFLLAVADGDARKLLDLNA